jgi:hypothetical protein
MGNDDDIKAMELILRGVDSEIQTLRDKLRGTRFSEAREKKAQIAALRVQKDMCLQSQIESIQGKLPAFLENLKKKQKDLENKTMNDMLRLPD